MQTVIIYHSFGLDKPCPDGIASAYFAKKIYPDAELIGCNYPKSNNPFQGLPKPSNKNIVIVDFSIAIEVINFWESLGNTLTIIDHHKSAIESLSSISNQLKGKLDISRCGAMLTFEYFFPGEPMPDFLWLINERDCGNIWALPQNEYWFGDATLFHHWCSSKGRTFELLEYLESLSYKEIIEVIQETKPRLKAKRLQCENLLSSVQIIVNCDMGSKIKIGYLELQSPIMSDMGKMVVDKLDVDMACILFDGQIHLRSSPNKDIDCSEVAKLNGGGGHKSAAGFSL